MENDFGLSFSPSGDPRNKQQGGPDPTQTSIQTLGLSIPHVVGASPLAPSALLNAPGGGGLNLQALLALLFGSRNPAMGGGAQTGLTPKVTPVNGPPQGGPTAGPMGYPGPSRGPSTPRGPEFPMPSRGGSPLIDLPQPPPAPPPMGPMGGPMGGSPRRPGGNSY